MGSEGQGLVKSDAEEVGLGSERDVIVIKGERGAVL